MKQNNTFKWSIIMVVGLWLMLFSFIPHLFILIGSVLKSYTNNLSALQITFEYYLAILFNPLYLKVLWRSFKLAAGCTFLCLIIAYPFAYGLVSVGHPYKNLLLSFVLVPFWTNSLIRTYAIIALLKMKGIINAILLMLGIIHTPLQLLYTPQATMLGLVYDLLPFMILPLYANFDRLDQRYIKAAQDLGASKKIILTRILIPLTMPGILGGSLLVFLPAMSLFYIPDMLGGGKSLYIGNLIQQQFLTGNWSLGSALSIMLLLLLVLFLRLGQWLQRKPL